MSWESLKKQAIFSEHEKHPHCAEERAYLFRCFDGGSTELEYLEFLHSLVRILKPNSVLETGSFNGFGTVAIASALKENGFGTLRSLEVCKEKANEVSAIISERGLSNYAIIKNVNSLEYLKNNKIGFDFAFFDSLTNIRPKEFELLIEQRCLKGFCAFHDTSRLREKTFSSQKHPQKVYVNFLDNLSTKFNSLEFPFSRGLRVYQIK